MDFEALAGLFKIFGDETRIKIMHTLQNGEKNVTEIATSLHMNQSAISHQLNTLKMSKFVKCRKEGKQSLYSIGDEHITEILSCGIEHLGEL